EKTALMGTDAPPASAGGLVTVSTSSPGRPRANGPSGSSVAVRPTPPTGLSTGSGVVPSGGVAPVGSGLERGPEVAAGVAGRCTVGGAASGCATRGPEDGWTNGRTTASAPAATASPAAAWASGWPTSRRTATPTPAVVAPAPAVADTWT